MASFKQATFVWILLKILLSYLAGNVMSRQIVYTVSEEVSPGTFVGNLAKDLNLKVDDLEPRGLRIVAASSKNNFAVNLKTGVLYVKETMDREQLCPNAHACTVNLEAIVNNPLNVYSIEVKISDINDNSPHFAEKAQYIQISELTFPGTKFPLLSAEDPDVGSNSVTTYKVSNNPFFSLEVNTDAESGPSPELVLQKALDRERMSTIQLVLTAIDGGKPSRSGTTSVIVTVLDINDNAPVFSKTMYKAQVLENASIGNTILKLNATDPDEGLNGEVVYKLKQGQKGIADKFAVNNTTGEITVIGTLDYEDISAYEIRVEAWDRGHTPLASHCKVLVEILDINDNAPDITLSSLLDNVSEDAKQGTVIAFITVQDKDGETALYNISIMATDEGTPPLSKTRVIAIHISDVNDNAPRFQDSAINVYVKENSPAGGQIATVSAQDYDYGENAQATDSGVPPLSSNATINVFILDENDNSPVILPPYSEPGSVNSENIPYSAEAGYFVAKIRAVDADSGYNALLSYYLAEPKGTNLFRIGSSTGEIRTKRRMSDNDLKTHPLLITVSDNGEPSLSATMSMDVVVVESLDDIKTTFREVPVKEESFSDLNLYLLIAIVSVSVIFLLSLVGLIAAKCYRTDVSFSRYSAPVISTHPDGSWSFSKSTQQYDVCFSSDTIKSDVVVFPSPFPPADAELISINSGDTFTRTQTLPTSEK
ncbi:hypothetical protein M9458_021766, partial [Cirrhinus mrigala]